MGGPVKLASPHLETLKIRALSEVCKLIGEAVHLDTTLGRVLQVLHDILRMERASLVLVDPKRKRLSIRASYGLSVEEERRGIYGLSEGVCGQIFQTGLPCVVPDVNSEPLFLDRTGARRNINKERLSFIGVPLFVDGRPAGVLTVDCLFGPEVSFEEDVSFLNVLATLISQFLVLHKSIVKKEERLVEENKSLKAELHSRFNRHYIIGQSHAMQEVFWTIEKVAPSRATALILGESGTGKELVARALHEASPRKDKPFIKVNCAALPENLLESELLGHEKGAFTGASNAKPGRFELAHGGTIFLDEIGELPLLLQAKLLRVIQESQFERIGGTRTITVDVRIIAATNVDLQDSVDRGLFRNDLFYRLNVVPIKLPALRERRDDIPLLIDHFLRSSNERNDKEVILATDALDFLMNYYWPGNVRELQNLIERLVILADDMVIRPLDLHEHMGNVPGGHKVAEHAAPLPQSLPGPFSNPVAPSSLRDMERQEIEAALRRNGWVQARAARELGLTQRQMGYRIKKFNLERPDFALAVSREFPA
ncbi:MAG: nif-specific transcriptional activator NifA [Proteobacteria bacterium]|nr:nif-specific transcriptional activator NifA [Pseudomonadota bacterium]MBU1639477.1 nif-specific transcriptional activator NifA [Pseudomonadota bacterium]